MKISQNIITAIIIMMVSFTSAQVSKDISKPESVNKDSAVAMVGKIPISYQEFATRYSDYLLSSGITDNMRTREGFLSNMINEYLLIWADDNSKIVNDPEYLRNLEWTRRQIVLAFLKDQEVYSKITCSDEETKAVFDRLNVKIAAKHLFAKTEQEAKYLKSLIDKGYDWDKLAYETFTDSTLKSNGGFVGYFTWGDMDPAFEEAAFNLPVGQVSNPVKTAYGYSIIKVVDVFKNPILLESDYVNKKHYIERAIKIRKKRPAENAFTSSVFNFKDINFNDKTINSIYNHLNLIDYSKENSIPASKTNPTALTFENKKYSQNEIEKMIQEVPKYEMDRVKNEKDLKFAIAGLLLQNKLNTLAESKGYHNTVQVRSTYNKQAKNVFVAAKSEIISRSAVVTDQEVKDYYTDHQDVFRSADSVNVQEIVLDSKQTADSLKSLIDKGADFGKVAYNNSIRRESAKKNGVIGYDDLMKFGAFKGLLWQADLNKVIGPFRVENEFVIFKVLGKKPGATLQFDVVRKDVEDLLRNQQKYLLVEKYAENLKQKTPVTINKELLGNFVLLK